MIMMKIKKKNGKKTCEGKSEFSMSNIFSLECFKTYISKKNVHQKRSNIFSFCNYVQNMIMVKFGNEFNQ